MSYPESYTSEEDSRENPGGVGGFGDLYVAEDKPQQASFCSPNSVVISDKVWKALFPLDSVEGDQCIIIEDLKNALSKVVAPRSSEYLC